ncbi:hypothetical protein Ndes2526A_g06530 [Nannochloris sp. 'desiccata']|nr:hypothetical protein KSW81_008332 [Chlorella desiccata (nom. nud.)]
MPPIRKPNPPLQDKILYFAYGANMSSITLAKRGLGAVPPGTVAQVTQPNIALVFGHRGGYATLTEVYYVEEGSCNESNSQRNLKQKWWQWQQLRDVNHRSSTGTSYPNSVDDLVYWQPYGVLYELTQEQIQRIEAKEIGYQRKIISVATCSTTDTPVTNRSNNNNNNDIKTTLDATVFVSAPYMTLRHPVAPTRRYRDLILQGAVENNLPESFTHWLEQMPVVVDLSVLGTAEYSNTLAEAVLKSIGVGILVGLSYTLFVGH